MKNVNFGQAASRRASATTQRLASDPEVWATQRFLWSQFVSTRRSPRPKHCNFAALLLQGLQFQPRWLKEADQSEAGDGSQLQTQVSDEKDSVGVGQGKKHSLPIFTEMNRHWLTLNEPQRGNDVFKHLLKTRFSFRSYTSDFLMTSDPQGRLVVAVQWLQARRTRKQTLDTKSRYSHQHMHELRGCDPERHNPPQSIHASLWNTDLHLWATSTCCSTITLSLSIFCELLEGLAEACSASGRVGRRSRRARITDGKSSSHHFHTLFLLLPTGTSCSVHWLNFIVANMEV